MKKIFVISLLCTIASTSKAQTIISSISNAFGDNPNFLFSNSYALTTTNDARATIWLDNNGKFKLRNVTGYGFAFTNAATNQDLVTIDNSGNMGVGTSNLITRFEIVSPNNQYASAGILHVNSGQAWGHVLALVSDGTNGTDDARLLFSYRNKSKQWSLGGESNATKFSIWEDGGDGVFGSGYGNERFTVLPGGNIGVGSSNPLSLFQVDDGCTKASIGDASGQALDFGTSYLGFNASRTGTNWLTSADGANNGGGVVYSSIFGDLFFVNLPSTGGSAGQTISDQFIKTHMNFRISSDGISHAKQLIVETTNWPDFVFTNNYHLKSLSEVKSYIDQNHHLPDMPSAAEVEKDGLNLGEMNKLLTKKLEELTLYLLEKDKELKEQNKRIEILEKKSKSKLKAK